jgi:hypothetical protein
MPGLQVGETVIGMFGRAITWAASARSHTEASAAAMACPWGA